MSDRHDKYNRSEKGRARWRRYRRSAKGKAAVRKYLKTEKGQAARRRYRASAKGQATSKARARRRQLDGRVAESKRRWRTTHPERAKMLDWGSSRRMRDPFNTREQYRGDPVDREIDRRLREKTERRYDEVRETENAGR